ncbi:zinc finger protein 516 [Elysia marginata]|uniref:Zinc finger protein 516 n=1 Tax=Elysia marginata TaxID=1093978 RepID=A0AAV4F7U0_9GAST|nr:zinc finger protein 516 [Elysia marginata]
MKSSRRKQTNPNRVAAGRDPNSTGGPALPGDAEFPVSDPSAGETEDTAREENAHADTAMFDATGREEEGEGSRPARSPSMASQNGDFEFPLDMSSAGGSADVPAPGHALLRLQQDSRRSPAQEGINNYLGPDDDPAVDFHKRRGSAEIRQPGDLKRPRLDVAEASRERDEEEPRDFPTAYHRLGRELQETSTEPSLTNGHMEHSPADVSSPRGSTTSPSQYGAEQQPSSKQSMVSSIHRQGLSPTAYPDYKAGPPQLPPPPLSGPTKFSNKDGSAADVQASTVNNNNTNKSDRIFHMDAYCELCDREFCNKYFLKTHKANKHGIYEDNSPPASSVPLPFPGMMMPQDPLMSFNFKMDSMKPPLPQNSSEPLAPWSFKLDSSSQPKKPQENSSRPADSPSLPLFPMPIPFPPSIDSQRTPTKSSSDRMGDKVGNILSISQSSNSNANSKATDSPVSSSSSANHNIGNSTSNSTSILTSITNSIKSNSNTNSNPPATDSSMEDYCHICQKHFCNKYYLKKHKQDVHGIAPENPPNSTNKRSRSSASSASSSLLDHPLGLSSHNAPSPFNLPQPLASLAGMHGLSGMPGLPGMPGMAGLPGMPNIPNMPNMPNMPPGVMVINPYSLPPMALIPGSLVPGQQLPPPPHHPMGITPLPDSALLPPPTSSSASSSSTSNHANSPTSATKPSPSIQDGGVHCNICSKEFCNEFYLQIHKESKHGIRRGSEDRPQSRDKAMPLVKETKHEHGTSGRPSPPPLSRSMTPKTEAASIAPPSRSPTDHRSSSAASVNSSQEERVMICNLCSKEFTNKYLYRIHRIHDHGLNELVDPTLTENGEMSSKDEAMRSMNESLMRMAADASAVSHASSFRDSPQGTNVLSNNASSNKLTLHTQEQTAVCDICNKEMTNQYFLRLHKFNVHGIDPTTNEKYDNKKLGFSNSPSPSNKPKTPPVSGGGLLPPSSPGQQPQPLNLTPHHPGKHPMLPFFPPKMDFKDMPPFADFGRDFHKFRDMPSFLNDTINNELFARSQNPARHMDLNFFGLPSLGKIPEDNVKLNFDPEAYCEICKKEFCSKYFLRTHKQNIHGIKMDPLPSSLPKNSSLDMDKMQTPLKPSIASNHSGGGNIHSSNSARSRGGNGGLHGGDPDKNSWRWKEPVNSSRVVCDICNKEVCNKYFLRTHKLKKHGIPLSAQSPNVSVSGSPVASDCDSASNASSLPEEKPSPLSLFRPSDPFNLPQMIPLPPSDTSRLADKYQLKQHPYGPGGKMKDEFQTPLSNNNNNNVSDSQQSETCNICSKRFKSLKWLKDHILKDHHISPPAADAALDMRSASSSSSSVITKSGVSYNNSNKDAPVYTCQVCRANFPAELSVQLHLIQEHNARVTLDTEPEPRVPGEEHSLSGGERGPSKPGGTSSSPRVAELTTHWGPKRKASPATWSSAAASRVKRYVCTRCDAGFSTPWLSSLLKHERTDCAAAKNTKLFESSDNQKAAAAVPGFPCPLCSLSFPSPNALSAHLVTVHAFTVDAAVKRAKEARVVFLPPNSTPPTPPNCFRCLRCPAVFPTRAWGVAHVRHVHIRSRRDLIKLRRHGAERNKYQKMLGKVSNENFTPPKSNENYAQCSVVPSSGSGTKINPAPFVAVGSASSSFNNINSVIMSTYSARSTSSETNSNPGLVNSTVSGGTPSISNQGPTISSSTNITRTHPQSSDLLPENSPTRRTIVNSDEAEDDDDDTTNNSPPSSLANDEGRHKANVSHDDDDDEDDDDDDDDDSALVSTSGVYQSIAASLLSAPASDGRSSGRQGSPEDSPSPPSTPDVTPEGPSGRDGAATFLQGFRHQIPLGSSAVDTSPFKMAGQTSAASAVVGGL